MISSLREFVALFDTKTQAAKRLKVSDAHLSMALKRKCEIVIEHEGERVISAHIQQIKKWGGNY